MSSSGEVTQLLRQWRDGDVAAFEQLTEAVYSHLHRVAEGYLQRERPGHTLQATGLVNEVFLRLLHTRDLSYADRVHFFTFAAKVMRRILVDYSRLRLSQKRGSGAEALALAPELAWVNVDSDAFLDLDRALEELGQLDAVKVHILELRYFLGMTPEETAEMLGLSRSTVDRAVRFSISWLHQRLQTP